MQAMHYWWIFLPNILLLGDWLQNRREVAWFFVLVGFGPLGAAAYTAYFWDSITFPVRLAALSTTLTAGSVSKQCPRCLQTVKKLEPFYDGRSTHYLCRGCQAEILSTRQ